MEEYKLHGAKSTGRTFGKGSYGSVIEIQYCHTFCAAKKLHETLLSPEDKGHEMLLRKFEQECGLMSKLRHPNVVQFLGVCYLSEDQQVPHLVMEKLETSVHDMLKLVPDLSLSLRLSWLEGVGCGLSYLHELSPPIIHRDLTATNVLLTSYLVAKVSDVGNSKILELEPDQHARTMTKQPGTPIYMAPEAMSERHRYGTPLDIFSFGCLALFTLIQVFPCDLKSSTYNDPESGEVKGRSEVQRREVYFSQLEETMSSSYPELIAAVRSCLNNLPEKRPSVDDLLRELAAAREEIKKVHGVEHVDVKHILARKEIERLKKEIKKFKDEDKENTKLLKEKNKCIEKKKEELNKKEKELSKTQAKLRDAQKLLEEKESELEQRNEELRTMERELRSREVEIQQLRLREGAEGEHESLEQSEVEIHKTVEKLKVKLDNFKKLLRLVKGVQLESESLGLEWKSGPMMPRPTGGYVQAVVLDNNVYVSGGHMYHDDVMVYDTLSQQWVEPLTYQFSYFSLARVRDQLVVIGGNDGENPTKRLSVLETDKKVWTYPYEDMPTPRFDASASTYRDFLIVSGGCAVVQKHSRGQHCRGGHGGGRGGFRRRAEFMAGNGSILSVCEILNVANNQWHSTRATPIPWTSMKTVVVGEVLYAVGGYTTYAVATEKVYSASVQDLIEQSSIEVEEAKVWKELRVNGGMFSTPVVIRGFLHLCGGLGNGQIRCYIAETEEWLEVGEMPLAQGKCAVAMTTAGDLFVAGGCQSIGRPLDLVNIGRLAGKGNS